MYLKGIQGSMARPGDIQGKDISTKLDQCQCQRELEYTEETQYLYALDKYCSSASHVFSAGDAAANKRTANSCLH